MPIVSVSVRPKPLHLKPGMIIWTNHFDVHCYEVTSEVMPGEANQSAIFVEAKLKSHHAILPTGWKTRLYLRDLGMPGFTYDSRPCCIFRSYEAAKAAEGRYDKWLSDISKSFRPQTYK